MAVDRALAHVITSYADQVAAVRRQVLDYVQRQWQSLDSWRDADIERFVNAVVPVVTGGQLRTAQLTDVYLASVEAATLGGPPRPAGVKPATVTDLAMRGTPAGEVYTRPGKVVWTALSRNIPLDVAVGYGLSRALSITSADMQLAKTHTARNVLSANDRVVGYVRVLSGGNSCALCESASADHYRTGQLMPIHPGCSCGVEPLYGGHGRSSSSDSDVVVHEHGELGPVLAVPGQHFTSADDF